MTATATTRDKLIAGLIAVACLTATFALFQHLRREQVAEIRASLDHDAEVLHTLIQSRLHEHEEQFDAVRRLFNASQSVERDELRSFLENGLAAHPDVTLIGWAPRLTAVERAGHEATIRRDGFVDYEIRDANPGATATRAPQRDHYFPLLYAEPESLNNPLIGIDLANYPVVDAAVSRAISSGTPTAALLPGFGPRHAMNDGLIIVDALYAGHTLPTAEDERRHTAQGVLILELHLHTLASSATVSLLRPMTRLALYDGPVKTPGRLLAQLGFGDTTVVANAFEVDVNDMHTPMMLLPLTVYNVPLTLAVQHDTTNRSRWSRYGPWLVLGLGLVITLLLVILALYSAGHYRRTMWLVATRTHELAESDLRNKAIIETVVDPLIVIDGRGIIQRVNPAVERVFGYAPSELLGNSVNTLMPPDIAVQHDSFLRHYQETGERHVIGIGRETVAQHKDGRQFAIDLSVNEMKIAGATHYVGIIHDISARKRAELAVQAAIKAKSAFLTNMTHELRTPMNIILGYAQLLETSTSGQEHENVEEIIKAGQHMTALVDGIMHLSRVESEEKTLALQPVVVRDAIAESLQAIRPLAERRHIRLEYQQSGVASMLRAEPVRLTQVLLNYLANAVKYNREQGQIFVEVSDADAGMCRVTVRDTGEGLTPEQMAVLFTPFTRLEEHINQVPGTGIGLALCKRLVEMMGGRVGVDSERGVGSAFWFELPTISAVELRKPQQTTRQR